MLSLLLQVSVTVLNLSVFVHFKSIKHLFFVFCPEFIVIICGRIDLVGAYFILIELNYFLLLYYVSLNMKTYLD